MRKLLILTAVAATALASCVDDNYDLSDIDTTVQVQVNDLVVPINLDGVTLSYIINLDKDDPDAKVREMPDGTYAVMVNGTFASGSDIFVDKVHIGVGSVGSAQANIASVPTIPGIEGTYLPIPMPVMADFNYTTGSSVSSSIVSIGRIGVDWTVKLNVGIVDSRHRIQEVSLRDFVLKVLPGLEATAKIGNQSCQYDAETGTITIPEYLCSGEFVVTLQITAVNAPKAGIVLDYAKHQIDFGGEVGVMSGSLAVMRYEVSPETTDISLYVRPELGEVTINTFSGEICYDIDHFSVPAVELNDLPDILSQDETHLSLAKPQIYLAIDNPFSRYHIGADAGLVMTAVRPTGTAGPFSPNSGKITIGDNGASGTYNMVLAPGDGKDLDYPYDNYPAAHFERFDALQQLLWGDGLPKSINIDIENPHVPRTAVTDFQLGDRSMGAVSGRYTFYAPLQLLAGSTITYTSTEKDWDTEDLQKVTITRLEVVANVTNNLPLNFEVKAWPLDVNGHRMNAEISGVNVEGNTTDREIHIVLTGEVKGLDGIEFTATATAPSEGNAFNANQTISLSNVKAVVSGHYTTEL